MATRLHLSGDADWDVQIDGDRVTFGGDASDAVTVERENGARLTVDAAGTRISGIAVVRGDVVWAGVDGHVFELRARHGGRWRTATAEQDALSPPMSATVVRILVKPGAAVAAGDLLIALEAMKMELGIRAPHDGTVKAVNCREGDLVQPGTPLIEM